MARAFVVFLCFFVCVQLGLCQFSFFPQREERRQSPFTIFPNTIRDTISGFLRPNRPNQGRPIANNIHQNNQQDYNQGNQNPTQNVFNQRPVAFPTNFPAEAPGNNQGQFTGQGNQGQFTGQGNQGDFTGQGNQGDFTGQGNQGDFTGQGNQGDFTGQGNQGQSTGQDNQGDFTGQGNQGFQPSQDESSSQTGQNSDSVNFDNRQTQSPNGTPEQADIPNDPVNLEDNTTPAKVEPTQPTTTFAPVQTTEATKPVSFPDTDSRNNFNSGNVPVFSQPCTTIDNDLGSCVSLYDCQPYLNILKESGTTPAVSRMLRQAHCGFIGNNPKVCCPAQGLPNTLPPTTTTTTTTTPTPALRTTPYTPTGGDFVPLPEPPVCGISNATLSRVVGGDNAKLGAFPWMALLGYKRGDDTMWLCGGSLISSRHILTAAHCVHNHEEELYLVRLGELDLAREDEGATPVDVLIKEKIKHAEYNAKAFTSDIAILVLDRDVQYTELIKPICIPKNRELRAKTFERYNPFIAGWGHTEFRGAAATHLQVLQLPVVTNEFCANAYKQYKTQKIDERVLCAGYVQGGKDACQGDSGGPLMQPVTNFEEQTSPMYQIGVVSYGKKCAEAGFPGVYTRVTHFVPWIEQLVTGTSDSRR